MKKRLLFYFAGKSPEPRYFVVSNSSKKLTVLIPTNLHQWHSLGLVFITILLTNKN